MGTAAAYAPPATAWASSDGSDSVTLTFDSKVADLLTVLPVDADVRGLSFDPPLLTLDAGSAGGSFKVRRCRLTSG